MKLTIDLENSSTKYLDEVYNEIVKELRKRALDELKSRLKEKEKEND